MVVFQYHAGGTACIGAALSSDQQNGLFLHKLAAADGNFQAVGH